MTWKIIGKTDWGEPVLQNEYGCVFEGGCGNAPDGHQCGECYGKDGCPVLRESCKENLEQDWADKRWPRISSFEDLGNEKDMGEN